MNKFELMGKVMVSDLRPEDKCLLVELLLRADEDGYSYPTVERLCKVRGIKHTKNFKGADHYLPGLVTKVKKGKRNGYLLNAPAIEGAVEASVVVYRGSWKERQENVAPSTEGVFAPSTAENAPATAENAPSTEGVDTTKDSSLNNTEDTSSLAGTAGAAPSNSLNREEEVSLEPREDSHPSLNTGPEGSTDPALSNDSTQVPAPATEGAKRYRFYFQGEGYDTMTEYNKAKEDFKQKLLRRTA